MYALFPGAEWKKNPADVAPPERTDDWPVPFEGITLQDDGCSKYCLGLATGLKPVPSPLKTRIALTFLGMRPISSMVDATNIAMLTLGQPTHAFDAGRLAAPEITVRSAKPGEEITTLDGKRHTLEDSDLLITSAGEAIGLAVSWAAKTAISFRKHKRCSSNLHLSTRSVSAGRPAGWASTRRRPSAMPGRWTRTCRNWP